MVGILRHLEVKFIEKQLKLWMLTQKRKYLK
jgi:hypothetical protein